MSNRFSVFGEDFIAIWSKNNFNIICEKYIIHIMDLPVDFTKKFDIWSIFQ